MNIYLDTNILIDLCDDGHKWLNDLIVDQESNYLNFPFSAEHIEELTDLKSTNTIEKGIEIKKRLNFISRLSSDIYFCNDMIVTEFRKRSPYEVFETLTDLPRKINYKKMFSNFISFDSLKNSREQLNLDSKYLNNIKPEETLKVIDKIINSSKNNLELNNYSNKDISVIGLLNKSMQISEDAHKGTSYHNIMSKKESYFIENFIVMLFSLLDSFGFWPDKKEVYSKGSRFADSRHCFNGIYFDYVISNDIRFCNKSITVYNHLKLNTKVHHLKKHKSEIQKLFKYAKNN